MTRTLSAILLAACLIAVPSIAPAQGNPWKKGTALGVFVGGARQSEGTDMAAGTSISWEMTPLFTIEGSGTWTSGSTVDTFSALIGTRVNLLPRRLLVPFVSGGAGMQVATVDGAIADVPSFYSRRMVTTSTSTTLTHTFDDFAWSVGGGVDVFINHHVALRPDLRVLLVHADGQTRPTTVYGVHLVYHFEEHAVTPSRNH
jgi:hypothetical protein